MPDAEFRSLVAAMRHAQQEYFRTRSETALNDSKRCERAVDRALIELSNPQTKLDFDA